MLHDVVLDVRILSANVVCQSSGGPESLCVLAVLCLLIHCTKKSFNKKVFKDILLLHNVLCGRGWHVPSLYGRMTYHTIGGGSDECNIS